MSRFIALPNTEDMWLYSYEYSKMRKVDHIIISIDSISYVSLFRLKHQIDDDGNCISAEREYGVEITLSAALDMNLVYVFDSEDEQQHFINAYLPFDILQQLERTTP